MTELRQFDVKLDAIQIGMLMIMVYERRETMENCYLSEQLFRIFVALGTSVKDAVKTE